MKKVSERERVKVSNERLAGIFEEIADMLEMKGENIFHVGAYRKAAEFLRGLDECIISLAKGRPQELKELTGLGIELKEKIMEFSSTGRIRFYEQLKGEFPFGFSQILSLKGVTPLKLKRLFARFRIKDLEQIKRCCYRGDVAAFKDFGEEEEKRILKTIEEIERERIIWPLETADKKADEIIDYLKRSPDLQLIEKTGDLRRACEKVDTIRLIVSSENPEKLWDRFLKYPAKKEEVKAPGKRERSFVLESGFPVVLYLAKKGSYGASLLVTTGSARHVANFRRTAALKGFYLNENGLFSGETGKDRIAGETEEEIYEKLELDLIPPELREADGELEAAAEGKIPIDLVGQDRIKGDLHTHTDVTDGRADIVSMISAAKKKGYEFLAITDHTKNVRAVGGLNEEEMISHLENIHKIRKSTRGIKVLAGAEVDILKDGSLDMPEELLEMMDIVIVAVHSHFDLDRDSQTKRVLKALSNERVNILAHPSARLIVPPGGINLDLEQVFAKCAAKQIALELNTHNFRMDLNSAEIKSAREYGAFFSINTDAHGERDLSQMTYGVKVAKRAWLREKDIINCMRYKELLAWLKK